MSKHVRCSILTSSLVQLEIKTRCMFIDINLVFLVLWRLFPMVKFITMATVSVLFVYLHMVLFCEASCHLKYFFTIIIAEYKILFGLELLVAIGAIQIEAFGDSLWVVQQISKGYQCFDESLIVYLEVKVRIGESCWLSAKS